jgi:hypothetical protein
VGSRSFPWAGPPRRDFTPGQNTRAFGSPTGVGAKPYPSVFPRVRAPHLPTPDAAPPCRSPVYARGETSAVALRLPLPRRRCFSPSRRQAPLLLLLPSTRRALPPSILPIQAEETASPSRPAASVQAPPPPYLRPEPPGTATPSSLNQIHDASSLDL